VVRPTYACRACERVGHDPQVIRSSLPPEPIPRGTAAVGLLAHLIVSKYIDHLPLYRQESMLDRLGWEVTRSTLCDQILACAGVLAPLYRLMCERVLLSAALHADDTPIALLAPRRTAHSWVYVGDADNPFDLSVGRSRVGQPRVKEVAPGASSSRRAWPRQRTPGCTRRSRRRGRTPGNL
jgi:hypothetical protein